MKLREIYSDARCSGDVFFVKKKPVVSFEIYPPKEDFDGEKFKKLVSHLAILKKYNPTLISLTYGAGGGSQSTSFEIIKTIQKELNLNVMPHFTCVGTKKDTVKKYLEQIKELNIENILALRGDIPNGVEQSDFDFRYANELVEFIKTETDLSVGVAGYPEGHIDCTDFDFDVENLKRKIDAGADAVYTQMFFDNDKYFAFVDLLRKKGITIPVIPGILPISSYGQLEKMLSMARVTLPQKIKEKLEKYKNNTTDIKKLGVDIASNQCQELIKSEVSGLHFFTLNTSTSLNVILENLNI